MLLVEAEPAHPNPPSWYVHDFITLTSCPRPPPLNLHSHKHNHHPKQHPWWPITWPATTPKLPQHTQHACAAPVGSIDQTGTLRKQQLVVHSVVARLHHGRRHAGPHCATHRKEQRQASEQGTMCKKRRPETGGERTHTGASTKRQGAWYPLIKSAGVLLCPSEPPQSAEIRCTRVDGAA